MLRGCRLVGICLAVLTAAACAQLSAALPAGAVVVKVHGHVLGVTPINNAKGRAFASTHTAGIALGSPFDEGPKGGTPLLYHGGPVMHSSETHVIYWDPNKEFSATTKGIVEKFFTDVAHDSGRATNVFGVNGQFTDSSGNAAYKSKFAGALTDAGSYPASGCAAPTIEADPGPPYSHCLLDEQLRAELKSFISAKGLPRGPTQFYALLLPHKVATCFEGEFGEPPEECSNNVFCAYHSSIEAPSASEILYADIPFSLLDTSETFGEEPNVKGCQDDGHPKNIQQPNPDNGVSKENSETRFADVALKYISHEFSETVTDPLGTAWFDKFELEDGDKCNGVTPVPGAEGIGSDKNSFLPVLGGKAEEGNLFNQSINSDSYYIQSEWDNAAKACRMTPLEITGASFTSSPASPVEGSAVEFKASATDPYEHPEFSWKLGDGTEAGGATVVHTYPSEGSYPVTLTIKDARTGSTTAAPVKHTLVVDELPIAAFSVEPFPVTDKAPAKFNGEESEDPDEPAGKIEKYSWNFGDGTKGEGAKPEHPYKAPGEYLVELKVEDSSKLTAEEAEFVRVIDKPAVVPELPSAIGQNSATLAAKVNPNGAFTECKFEYGKTEANEHVAPCSHSAGSEFEPVAVSATIAGLEPSTEYRYRVVAKNEVPEVAEGAVQSFKTLKKLPPTIAGEAASSVAQTGATLNGSVNPNGAEVSACKFEYGTTAGFYEASVPCAALPAGAGSAPIAAAAAIGGLTASTTYHFRLVATSAGGEGAGTDATFTTTALPPPPPTEGGKNPPPPDSSFTASSSVNRKSGVITFVATVKNPGTFTGLATFANGKFGAFSSRAAKCKRGFVRLAGKCRRSKITFAKVTASVSGAGTVTFALKPTASARKALKFALKHRKGMPVTVTLAFQSSRGGVAVSKTFSITVKLAKK